MLFLSNVWKLKWKDLKVIIIIILLYLREWNKMCQMHFPEWKCFYILRIKETWTGKWWIGCVSGVSHNMLTLCAVLLKKKCKQSS